MIHAKARKMDSQNPQEASNGYKNLTIPHSLVTKKSTRFQKRYTRNYLINDNFLNTALDLKIFSPREPLGILILFLGLVFTGMIFYIIYAVSTNKESLRR